MSKFKTDISRRDFLKNAGTAGIAVGAASVFGTAVAGESKHLEDKSVYEKAFGDDVQQIYVKKGKSQGPKGPIGFEDRKIAKNEITKEYNCDIAVVGGGMSGLIAALKGAEDGAKVVLIEKMTEGRGAFECFGAVDSRTQREAGIKTDKAVLLGEMHRSANYRIGPDVVRTYVEKSGEASDFMEQMFEKAGTGVVIAPMPLRPKYPNTGAPVIDAECMFYNTPGLPKDVRFRSGHVGLYIIQDLTKIAKKHPNITAKYSTPAAQLVIDSSGRVTGVIAKEDGKYVKINAKKGVILATGGYDANPEMMKAYLRPEDYSSASWWNPCWGTTGDGHMMGLKVGAAMDPVPHAVMNFTFGSPESFHIPAVRTLRAMGLYAMVNDDGERFVREDTAFQFISNATNRQASFGKQSWLLFDDTMISKNKETFDKAIAAFKVLKEKGWLFEANSPSELEKLMKMPKGNLVNTVKKFNAFKKDGKDQDFNRDMEFAKAFDGNKIYALVCNSVILATVSGLIIDEHGRVLNTKGEVIKGLYAAGNASGDFFSGNYPRHIPGTSMGRAITFGYLSAKHAITGV
ncbi:FAD-binding protein [Shewanella psychrotolerans]|uniref:FAD-binding protein n=1 Tax=Shewanella psychrotolerans TaxID=2864206 RepID=UPI001C65B02B|nr:FAD-binding protein [Shewanella psychrotolerans]QYK00464.1 FAD-binding protein [Shewanella psychrotolerans]